MSNHESQLPPFTYTCGCVVTLEQFSEYGQNVPVVQPCDDHRDMIFEGAES